MVKGHGKTIASNPVCCILNVVWVKLWIKVKVLTANYRNAASPKNRCLFCHQTKQIRPSIVSYLLNHPFETSLHLCNPFWILHQGQLCFSNVICSLLSPHGKDHRPSIPSTQKCSVPSFVEFSIVVLEKMILKFRQFIFAITLSSPPLKGVSAFFWIKHPKFSSVKNALFQVLLNFV